MTTAEKLSIARTATEADVPSLRQHIMTVLNNYFTSLGNATPADVKSIVFDEVESALYEVIMKHTKGNQSRAALLLGVSRGTLRSKLHYYFNTTHVGLVSPDVMP